MCLRSKLSYRLSVSGTPRPLSGYSLMTKLLQDKDDHWRARPNGATPVFDPGLSALGTDEEAGGARAPAASTTEHEDPQPMSATPISERHGPRLKPYVWWMALAAILVALAVAAVLSL